MKKTAVHTGRERDRDAGERLLLNKPSGWTSFDVVAKVRRILGVRKVGHAGTLDPLATGLLIVCTGPKTKETCQFADLEKEYQVRMMLGGRTESGDSETPVFVHGSLDDVTPERVEEVLSGFVGHQTQIPPMWSAVKVRGRRLYKYARKGIEVERQSRDIFVRSIQITGISLPVVEFTVVCSKGTYIRTLVDDAGLKLGCGAYVTALERTRIGEFHVKDSLTLRELEAQHHADVIS